MNKTPIYILSKNRAYLIKRKYTIRILQEMNRAFYVIVEDTDVEDYARALGSDKNLLVLPQKYKQEYELCDNRGLSVSTGPGPARNFAWSHSIDQGHRWHWVMDDNINDFFRLNGDLSKRAKTAQIFSAMEDFCDQFENVAMAGPEYQWHVRDKKRPYMLNTKIFSCNLIRNDIPFRWRGRYNEDTILSLDILKAGWCTVQFKAFLQNKECTQLLKGGNTDEFYSSEGTYLKSKMLVEQHGDCAKLVKKYGRPHHHVNYRRFKQKLIKKKNPPPLKKYKMKLVDNPGWKPVDSRHE